MTDETMPLGLWQETRQAAAAWEQTRGTGGDEPMAPGTVLVGQVLTLPELGEPRLAWAALRREKGEQERLLLVAADVNPLVGPGDVAVTGPAVGSLTLRCRLAVWISDRELGTATLLGTLPPEALSRADSRLQAIEAGRPVVTFSEQETEEDPEYQDWIEDVVRPAVGKLVARVSFHAPGPSPTLPFPARAPAEGLPFRRGAWMRWAAVLAFVGLGAVSVFLWWRQGQEIAGLRAAAAASEAAHRQAIAELEARRADLEAQYQARLRKVGEDRARLESEHRKQLAELEGKIAKLRQATEVKNVLYASLEPDTTLRGPNKLELGPETSHLVLALTVYDPAGTEFQVEVSERYSGRQIFVQKGLRADVRGEVWLGIPASLLPPGDYRLRLFRKEGTELHRVREHLIEIAEEPERRLPR
jgi:hypothetical protein